MKTLLKYTVCVDDDDDDDDDDVHKRDVSQIMTKVPEVFTASITGIHSRSFSARLHGTCLKTDICFIFSSVVVF
jgi:hypothetical protein